MADISKYAGFFHDGSITDIEHIGNKMTISMESAEIDEENIQGDILLAEDDRFRGKLHIEGITEIKINKEPFLGRIQMVYNDGGIFTFELKGNFIKFCIDWVNFPPQPEVHEFSVIKIEAEKIWWENLPNEVIT